MQKAPSFKNYFNDPNFEKKKLKRMQLTRKLVLEIYPDVQERVSYAMLGFYSKEATKTSQQLFLVRANKNWLEIHGASRLPEEFIEIFIKYDLEFGNGSIKVPYDIPVEGYRELLKLVMVYNAAKHGFEL